MEKNIKTKGIILKRINLNDADQICTVLTHDSGKISILAKGSKRIKSKFNGKLELLNVIDIEYFKGSNLGYLNDIKSTSFNNIIESTLKTKSILFYITELTNKLIQEDQQIDGIYKIFNDSIEQILNNEDKSELILYAYTIKVLTLLGFMAPWDKCTRSGIKLNLEDPLFLHIQDCSVITKGYNSFEDVRLTPPLIKWVNFMQKADFKDIMMVNPSKGERVQVWYMIKVTLENILSSAIKSEEFMAMAM